MKRQKKNAIIIYTKHETKNVLSMKSTEGLFVFEYREARGRGFKGDVYSISF